MSIRFDDKGKFFTDVVSKDSVPVIIQTTKHRVTGYIYVRPGERFKDEINNLEQFFAITEATIWNDNGEKLFECEFFSLNRDYILWLLPQDKVIAPKKQKEGGES